MSDCYFATAGLSRAVGLLGTPDLGPGEGLWIPRCRSVHSLGMGSSIGCVFIDLRGTVLEAGALMPWRIATCRTARAVLEVHSQNLAPFTVGRRLAILE